MLLSKRENMIVGMGERGGTQSTNKREINVLLKGESTSSPEVERIEEKVITCFSFSQNDDVQEI